jgi:gluconolactonase
METVATGLSFPEGPVFDAEGNLYVVEIAAGRVAKIAPDGTTTRFADTGGGPNGMALGPAGQLWVANSGGLDWGEVVERPGFVKVPRIEQVRRDGTVSVLSVEADGRPLQGPNDVVVDREGGLWFTDPGGPNSDIVTPRGRVCWASPDGRDVRVVVSGYQYPNGLALRVDDGELIVDETGSGRLWIHDVRGPGSLGERRPFAEMPEGYLPDGMCLDASGRVLVAGCGGAGLVVFDEGGKQLDRLEFSNAEAGLVTNVAFRPGQAEIYVTIGRAVEGTVVRLPWDEQGAPLPGWTAQLA